MSAETKFTPGPWQRADDDEWRIDGAEPSAACGVYVATVASRHDFDVDHHEPLSDDLDAEFEANASLIAAAPDLYAALSALVTEIRAYCSPECDDEGAPGAAELKAADAALAKARGEA
jgi:hypothetical protein